MVEGTTPGSPPLTENYFTKGWPGDPTASLWSLSVMRVRSASVFAAAKRLRSWTIFSLRVRRRRISGRRLGADIRCSCGEFEVAAGTRTGDQVAGSRCSPVSLNRRLRELSIRATARLPRSFAPPEKRLRSEDDAPVERFRRVSDATESDGCRAVHAGGHKEELAVLG
jgi:hypothetical protein